MAKKKKATAKNNTKKNTTGTADKNFEELIKEIDLSLANLEKIGAAFLIFGYANYIRAAQLDILDVLELNNTGLTPASTTVMGQKFVLLGYVTLYIVASRRLNEKKLENSVIEPDNPEAPVNLSPYETIVFSYLISLYANAIRLGAFIELEIIDQSGEVIE